MLKRMVSRCLVYSLLLVMGSSVGISASYSQQIQIDRQKVVIDGRSFTVAVIQVDPEYQDLDLSMSRIDRLTSIQLAQETKLQARSLLEATQGFVARNYESRGHVDAQGNPSIFTQNSALKYPDPTGIEAIIQRETSAQPKTKVDDFLLRRSFTISVFADENDLNSIVATIKVVKTDFIRVNKDFSSVIPPQIYREWNFKSIEFEIENFSVSSKEFDFFPYFADRINSSTIFSGVSKDLNQVILKMNALTAPAPLYYGMGFEPYFEKDGVTYFSMSAEQFKARIQKYVAVKSTDEMKELPWVRTLSADKVEAINQFFNSRSKKIRFQTSACKDELLSR